MGLLDALIYGLRDVFDVDDNQLPRRSRVKFNGTVTDDPTNDRLIVDAGDGGGGTPDNPNKTIQTNLSGDFKSLENFNREGNGHLNVERHEFSGYPELIFDAATKTLTRSYGSFVTEGYTTGPVTISGIVSPYQTANNGVKTITVVSALVLTFSDTITDDDIAGSDVNDMQVRLDQGGYTSYGLTSGTLPGVGDHRIAKPAAFQPDHVWASSVNDSNEEVPLVTIQQDGGGIGIGGSLTQEDTSTGTTKWWDRLGILATHIELRSLFRQWRYNVYILEDEGWAQHSTTSATPATITVPTLIRSVYREVTLTAASSTGHAVWKWSWLPDGTQTLTLENHSTTAVSWTASISGNTITITGASFTAIGWQATVVGK